MFATELERDGAQTRHLSPPADNDNRAPAPSPRHPAFPEDAFVRIYRPGPSVTSSRRKPGKWTLAFEARTAPWIEPLMGWTTTDDTLSQVRLTFPDLQSAIAYAERQGLPYVVHSSHESPVPGAGRAASRGQSPAGTTGTVGDLPTPWLDGYGVGVQIEYGRGRCGTHVERVGTW